MVRIEDYGEFTTTWCPGCGNFPILKAIKTALVEMNLAPHQVLMVSGIGQAAKMPHYMRANAFNGLHGRALPAAQGAKIANRDLKIFVNSGDGCTYGEGGNHFLAAMRRNLDLTMIVHDNQIYGLTKGQASPMTQQGHVTKAQPLGVLSSQFNPIAVAVGLKTSFVARSFAGDIEHMVEMIKLAANHEGFALLDIMQPCVSFNKINTFAWYKERCYKLPDDYDPTDWSAAMEKSQEFDKAIPIGVIYHNDRPSYESQVPALAGGPLCDREVDYDGVNAVMMKYA